MRIAQTRLSIDTAPREIKEITAEVVRWTESQRVSTALLTIYILHTSASLLIQENASPDVLRDLDAFLRRIVPEDTALYRHNDEGPDDMPAHIKSALTQTPADHPRYRRTAAARHLAGHLPSRASRLTPPPLPRADVDRRGNRRLILDRLRVARPVGEIPGYSRGGGNFFDCSRKVPLWHRKR